MFTVTRKRRRAAAAGVALALAGALVATSAGAASAAETNTWGTFALSGASRAYTGTMTLPGGFPATSFTSTASTATQPSGSSTWQAPGTPPGAVYGTSKNRGYLNLNASAGTAGATSTTTYTFATPTPASGWSFVLGDIDADRATITATTADGAAAPVSALGFQSVYNYCHQAAGPSCDSANNNDVPIWDPATGILSGNVGAADTEGAAGWFSPTVPLKTLTIAFTQRSGSPVYQTWFATKTFTPSGAVTVNGQPYGGAALTIADASGAVVATTTTNGDGTWSVPGLVSTSGYQVSVATPPGATDAAPLTFDTLDADTPGLDFAFTIPTVAVSGAVSTPTGEPAANESLVFTREGDDAPAVTTTTDATGNYTADLLPEQTYTAILDGATDQPITLTTTADPTQTIALAEPGAPAPPAPPAPPVPPVTAPAPGPAPVVPAGGGAPELAMTGSNPAVPLGLGILLALSGVALALRGRLSTRRQS